ncbi:hypothetical protein Hanom_Chr05g00426721 [Helianthus anomalus]
MDVEDDDSRSKEQEKTQEDEDNREENRDEENNMFGDNNPADEDKEPEITIPTETEAAAGDDVPENTIRLENEATCGNSETINAEINYGGNWREIFADCVRNEQAAEILSQRNDSPRYMPADNNNDNLSGANRVISFQAGERNLFGPEGRGPNGDTRKVNMDRRPNLKVASIQNKDIGLDNDPFK